MASTPPDATVPTLDLRGLTCPLPVLRTRKALRGQRPGARLRVLASDPLAAIDIPHFLRESGDVLEGQGAAEGALWFLVRKA